MKNLTIKTAKDLKKIKRSNITNINGIEFGEKYPILEITNAYASYYDVEKQSNTLLIAPFTVTIKESEGNLFTYRIEAIEKAVKNGNNFAYGTGIETLKQALEFGNTTQTREQAEQYALNEYKTSNPSDNSSLDTLIENGKIWIWDLSEELQNI